VKSLSSPPTYDLHRHLDGSLRYETLLELNAAQNGPLLPSEDELRFFEGMGLVDALSRFKITLSVLQNPESVRRVAKEMIEDAEQEGLSGLEIRFAPQLHGGDTMENIVDAALDGIGANAGLILCGLYGEPPQTLENLVNIADERERVLGIDLAGGPAPSHAFHLEDYAASFQRAGRLGLGRTVHASEGRPPDEIIRAVEILGANRIGHGTTLLESPDAVQLVLDRGITIEACPTSNVHVGAIRSIREHPIKEWIKLGVRVVVCADNTLFSNTDAMQELSGLDLDDGQLEFVSRCTAEARFSL
jgi:adenosine deaminase